MTSQLSNFHWSTHRLVYTQFLRSPFLLFSCGFIIIVSVVNCSTGFHHRAGSRYTAPDGPSRYTARRRLRLCARFAWHRHRVHRIHRVHRVHPRYTPGTPGHLSRLSQQYSLAAVGGIRLLRRTPGIKRLSVLAPASHVHAFQCALINTAHTLRSPSRSVPQTGSNGVLYDTPFVEHTS